MKTLISVLLALSLFGCASTPIQIAGFPDIPEKLYEWGEEYVWSVKRFREGHPIRPKGFVGHGSGVWLDEFTMVTACHVPSYYETMWASQDAGAFNGVYVDMEVNFCDRATDQAVMTITHGRSGLSSPVILGDLPARGERVYIIGFPGDHALTVTTGWFVGKNAGRRALDKDSWGLAANAMGGNSGGAVVVVRNGEIQLVGILVAGFPSGHITEMKDLSYTKNWLNKLQ